MGVRHKGRDLSVEEAAALGLPGGYVDMATLQKLQEAARASAPGITENSAKQNNELERPGASRPPESTENPEQPNNPEAAAGGKVLPFARPPTLGDLLGVAPPSPAFAEPPPVVENVSQLPAPIGPSPEVQTFAGFASQTITAVGVSVIGGIIRRKRREPNEPDDDVVERVNELQTQLIAERLGNQQIPTWAILMTAWGQLGMSMAMGAKPIEGGDNSPATPPPSAAGAPAAAGKVVFGAPPPLR